MKKFFSQTGRVILLLGVFASTSETGLAQVANDGRNTTHVFPQFVDGSITGSRVSYKSALIVYATDAENPTQCKFLLIGVPDLAMTNARGVTEANTVFNISIPPNGWEVIRSSSNQSLAIGSARLDCDRNVVAQLRYTLRIDEQVASEATVSSASPGSLVQFLADHRDGARVGVAVTNPSNIEADYEISVTDVDGGSVGSIVVRLAPGTSLSNFVDAIVPVPAGHVGMIVVQARTPGAEAYALGLRFTGEAFSTVHPIAKIR